MADKKISQLTGATTPLAGTEEVPLVQSGVTKKVATNNFLLPSNIGSTVQGYDANTAKLNVAQTWTAAQKFNNTIGVGGATPAASGAGVTFPATQSASSDANTLDDYEEGTFTATLTAATPPTTPPTSTAQYTRIGNIVTVHVTVNGNTTGASGQLRITGLPFTAASVEGQCGSAWVLSVTAAGGQVPYIASGATTITFITQNGGSLTSISTDTDSYVRLSITYFVS